MYAVCSFQLAITKLLYFRYLVAVEAIGDETSTVRFDMMLIVIK